MTPHWLLPSVKNRALIPITLIVFIDVLGFTVVVPLLPLYAQAYGASPTAIGALFSIYAACALVAAPLLGRWSDRYGRKPVLLVSQLGTMLSFVMLALAPSLAWLFVARALDGFTAGNMATARACISDVTAPKDRSAAFGVIAAAFGFGYMVGPAGAGLLAAYGHQVPLWAAAGLSATSLLCTAVLLPSTRPTAPASTQPLASIRQVVRAAAIGPRLWEWFAFLTSFGIFTAGFALFCAQRLERDGTPFGATEVGLLFAYIGLLGLVAQLGLLRRLVDRFGEALLVRWNLVAAMVAYAVMSFAHSLWLLLACLSFTGIANSLLRPSLLGLISQQVPATRQGAVFGVTQSLQSLAMIIGPLIAGGLIHLGWLSGWALACAVALLLALLAAPRRPSTARQSAAA
ncbi:MAG: MFS transporter [Panacagrimonas sp.]